MSAWAELINADGSDEWLELCGRALKEVQEETLRRAAWKIRGMEDGVIRMASRRVSDIDVVADLIDPEATR
ncbi:putative protein OS=Streptomyces microflavus OX=1919 GN=Smic_80990 PE=4 SV=1 [Streptomyces microflavus]